MSLSATERGLCDCPNICHIGTFATIYFYQKFPYTLVTIATLSLLAFAYLDRHGFGRHEWLSLPFYLTPNSPRGLKHLGPILVGSRDAIAKERLDDTEIVDGSDSCSFTPLAFLYWGPL